MFLIHTLIKDKYLYAMNLSGAELSSNSRLCFSNVFGALCTNTGTANRSSNALGALASLAQTPRT